MEPHFDVVHTLCMAFFWITIPASCLGDSSHEKAIVIVVVIVTVILMVIVIVIVMIVM